MICAYFETFLCCVMKIIRIKRRERHCFGDHDCTLRRGAAIWSDVGMKANSWSLLLLI